MSGSGRGRGEGERDMALRDEASWSFEECSVLGTPDTAGQYTVSASVEGLRALVNECNLIHDSQVKLVGRRNECCR